MRTEWFSEKEGGTVLSVQIQPRASKTEVIGLHGEPPRLKIRIAAPPVDGAANEELIGFLSRKLGIPKSHVQIVRGATGKTKDIFCGGVGATEIRQRLHDG